MEKQIVAMLSDQARDVCAEACDNILIKHIVLTHKVERGTIIMLNLCVSAITGFKIAIKFSEATSCLVIPFQDASQRGTHDLACPMNGLTAGYT